RWGEGGGRGGGADWRHRVGVGETHPLFGQPVQVRRVHHRMAGAAHRVPAHLVHHDEEDIGPRGGGGSSCLEQPGGRSRQPLASRYISHWTFSHKSYSAQSHLAKRV